MFQGLATVSKLSSVFVLIPEFYYSAESQGMSRGEESKRRVKSAFVFLPSAVMDLFFIA